MFNKKNYEKILKDYFLDKPGVLCAYLFGSVAREKEHSYSDMDIAVLYDDSILPSEYADRQITLSVDLSQLLNRNVDMVILNRASPYLKFQIIREGIRIYESPKRKDRSFEAHSIIEYFDFLPIKNLLEASLLKRLKEA